MNKRGIIAVNEFTKIEKQLNKIDLHNGNKYDLLNLYESVMMGEEDEKTLSEMLESNAEAEKIHDFLCGTLNEDFEDNAPQVEDEYFFKATYLPKGSDQFYRVEEDIPADEIDEKDFINSLKKYIAKENGRNDDEDFINGLEVLNVVKYDSDDNTVQKYEKTFKKPNRKEVYKYLKSMGGYVGYDDKIQSLMDDFGLDQDTAESLVWNFSSGLYKNESLSEENKLDESTEISYYPCDVNDTDMRRRDRVGSKCSSLDEAIVQAVIWGYSDIMIDIDRGLLDFDTEIISLEEAKKRAKMKVSDVKLFDDAFDAKKFVYEHPNMGYVWSVGSAYGKPIAFRFEQDFDESLSEDTVKGNFSDLRKALKRFNENGKYAKQGDWKIGKGGYDLNFEVCYKGEPIIQGVNDGEKTRVTTVVDTDVAKQASNVVCDVYKDCYIPVTEDTDIKSARRERFKKFHDIFDSFGECTSDDYYKAFELFSDASVIDVVDHASKLKDEYDGQKVKYRFTVFSDDYKHSADIHYDPYQNYIGVVVDKGEIREYLVPVTPKRTREWKLVQPSEIFTRLENCDEAYLLETSGEKRLSDKQLSDIVGEMASCYGISDTSGFVPKGYPHTYETSKYGFHGGTVEVKYEVYEDKNDSSVLGILKRRNIYDSLNRNRNGSQDITENDKRISEDTIKQGSQWVNKGKEGTHGNFKTKKEADAQRKAMFSRGFKEGVKESIEDVWDDASLSGDSMNYKGHEIKLTPYGYQVTFDNGEEIEFADDREAMEYIDSLNEDVNEEPFVDRGRDSLKSNVKELSTSEGFKDISDDIVLIDENGVAKGSEDLYRKFMSKLVPDELSYKSVTVYPSVFGDDEKEMGWSYTPNPDDVKMYIEEFELDTISRNPKITVGDFRKINADMLYDALLYHFRDEAEDDANEHYSD